jgi:hypothetical protein
LAAPTNTLITNNAVGNRESLHNIIAILNKDETPFQAAVGFGSAEATYEEWQLDALGKPTHAQLEGDDTTAAAIVPTRRVGNRTQILKKPFTISATQEVRLARLAAEQRAELLVRHAKPSVMVTDIAGRDLASSSLSSGPQMADVGRCDLAAWRWALSCRHLAASPLDKPAQCCVLDRPILIA